MTVLKKIWILIALSLLLSACDSAYGPEYQADGNPAKLMGKKWHWVGYTTLNGGYFTDVPDSSYFRITDGTISGVDGCNAFSGVCRVDRSVLRADSMMSTRRGCGERRSFACSMESAAQYRQRDSMLILIPEAGEMVHLVFKIR